MQRVLVLALAAWMSLCCCEKRILAHAFDSAPEVTRSCCSSGCCAAAEDDRSHDADPPHERTDACCADGCCAKAFAAASVFVPAVDLIGAPLPPEVCAVDPCIGCGRVLSHEDRTAGEPPPRLALLISRRLRI